MKASLCIPRSLGRLIAPALVVGALAAAACAPAAPNPTAAPAKPTEAPKPAATAAPAKPAEAKPAASPAAKAEAKPAASPAPQAAPKPSAKVDTKALEDFYKGKTVRIIVGSAPGGGYDTYARTLTRHIGRHIPGAPNVIVENMEGAGSLRAANHVYNAAAKDGTVIGHIQGGLFLQQLLGLPGVEFEALKWQVLGLPTADRNTCVATAKSGLKSLADAMNPGGKQYIAGGNAPGSATWDVAMRLRASLDMNLKMVEGYDGTAKVRLAMDSGEIDGMCGWGYESLRATGWDKVTAGEYVVIGQVVEQPLPELEKAPMALELARTDEAKNLIRLGIMVPSKLLRPFLVAPEVPADRVMALRQAFDASMKDAEFLADAGRAKLEVAPIPAAEAEKGIRDLFTMPEDIKAKLKAINDKKA